MCVRRPGDGRARICGQCQPRPATDARDEVVVFFSSSSITLSQRPCVARSRSSLTAWIAVCAGADICVHEHVDPVDVAAQLDAAVLNANADSVSSSMIDKLRSDLVRACVRIPFDTRQQPKRGPTRDGVCVCVCAPRRRVAQQKRRDRQSAILSALRADALRCTMPAARQRCPALPVPVATLVSRRRST